MAKLLLLVTLVTMILVVHGAKLNLKKFLNRRDPFPEPENPPPPSRSIVENFITQRLDNFSPTNNATWQQRYLMNGEFFQPGGCIFLFLAGEWTVTPVRLETSLMNEMAREFFCYIFYLEHRYYGESRPTDDLSNENLQYLTDIQALADTAHFVEYIRRSAVTPGAENSPVIVIGVQYSASLAVWFRQSYPHLTVAAWASSAPLNSYIDFFQYKELAGAVYRHIGGNECYNRLESGFAGLEQLVAEGRSSEISDLFGLCEPIESQQDVRIFFAIASEIFSLFAQFNEVIASVANACVILTNETYTPIEAIVAIRDTAFDNDGCIDIDYERLVYEDRQTSWDAISATTGARQWTFQACSQHGWYHSSASRFQPFGSSFPVEFFYQACEDVFDEIYSVELQAANSARLNVQYGGANPRTTNTLFTHGQFDPWRTAGVQTDQGESNVVLIIDGASEGNDLGPIGEDDSPAVVAAKNQIKQTIYGWIRASQGIIIIPL